MARRMGEEPLELKEACVRAAHQVIAEHGVERLSLREVARRLGVSHQAPYRHYPSRDHLLAEVMRRSFESFAQDLDRRERSEDPSTELAALGRRYLAYAAAHPLEYRLMFGTPWPRPADHPELVRDAVHAFDVLRTVLKRIYGDKAAARTQVDLQAMFIWSTMHGMASIAESNAVECLQLSPKVTAQAAEHVMRMVDVALRGTSG